MLSIYATTEYHAPLKAFISKEDRLDELIKIVDLLEERPASSATSLLIKSGEIGFALDWQNTQPPFLLPDEIELNEANLLGIVFAKLNNYEKAYEYLQQNNPSLFKELDFVNRLQQGIPINPNELTAHYTPFEEYRLMHNNAVLRHYASTPGSFDPNQTAYFYEEAMKSAPTDEHRAFTARQYALLCIDLEHANAAVQILEDTNTENLSKEAQTEIKHTLCQAWINQLTKPYDPSNS